jgi:hypothetical protein
MRAMQDIKHVKPPTTTDTNGTFQDEDNANTDLRITTYMVVSNRKKPSHPRSSQGNILKENFTDIQSYAFKTGIHISKENISY